jgi:hypothetical protein
MVIFYSPYGSPIKTSDMYNFIPWKNAGIEIFKIIEDLKA